VKKNGSAKALPFFSLLKPKLSDSNFGFCGRQTQAGLDAHRQNRSI
jgi:hypothetical protein